MNSDSLPQILATQHFVFNQGLLSLCWNLKVLYKHVDCEGIDSWSMNEKNVVQDTQSNTSQTESKKHSGTDRTESKGQQG